MVLVASLLFQQVAVAAFVCPGPAPAPMMADCAAMQAMPQSPAPAPLCEKHCSPDQTLPSDAAISQVLAPAIAPMAYALVVAVHTAPSAPGTPHAILRWAPPRTRYCRLLI